MKSPSRAELLRDLKVAIAQSERLARALNAAASLDAFDSKAKISLMRAREMAATGPLVTLVEKYRPFFEKDEYREGLSPSTLWPNPRA